MMHGLFMSTKRTTGSTHKYLPLISYYSQVQSAQQKLLVSIFNSSVITLKECIPHVARAQHASYLQNFLRHEALHAFFVNLDVSCTVWFACSAQNITCVQHTKSEFRVMHKI